MSGEGTANLVTRSDALSVGRMTADQPPGTSSPVTLRALLQEMVERGASDLHILAGECARLRIDGDIVNTSSECVLTANDTQAIAYSILTEAQKNRFEKENELDFSFGIDNLSRFRGNIFKQRQSVSMVVRQIPLHIKPSNNSACHPSSPNLPSDRAGSCW